MIIVPLCKTVLYYDNICYSLSYDVGVCVGFEVMSSHESPNIPFTLLKTRFTKGIVFAYTLIS